MTADHGFSLDEAYRVERFADSDVAPQDVIDMWVREDAMPREEAERRVGEVHMVATTPSEGVVGVTTAYLAPNAQLGREMWHQRAFIAAAHRQSALGINMFCEGRDDLSHAYETGRDRRAPGILMEVENEGLKSRYPHAVWYMVWFTFIGLNAKGDHVRVHWFPGAEVR